MSYCFLYDTNGMIKEKHSSISTWTNTNYYNSSVIGHVLFDDSDAMAQDAFAHPEKYLIQNDKLVLQPYFTLAFASGTVTATLNNPPATPPTQATFSVLGQTYTEALTNNQATLNLTVHPAVAGQQINVTASATGCVDGTLNVGGSDTGVSMKVVTTTTPNTVSPVYRKDGEAYYACVVSPESLFADIGTANSLNTHIIFEKVPAAMRLLNKLLTWAQQPTYAPLVLSTNDQTDVTTITLNTDESNALSDIQTNLLPNLYTTLKNAYPSGGTKQRQYDRYVIDAQTTYNSFSDYDRDITLLGWI